MSCATRHIARSPAYLVAVLALCLPNGAATARTPDTPSPRPAPMSWRAFGPFFSAGERPWRDSEIQSARPRPFFVQFDDPERNRRGWDALWPLAVHRVRNQAGRDTFVHTRLALGFVTREASLDDDASDIDLRLGIAPLLFGGDLADKGRYAALFPVGGTLLDVAGYDRLSFALFPLFLNTVRGPDVQHAFLWPILSTTHRNGELRKWRIFPLYGYAQSGTRTQRFFLWPIGHTLRKGPDPAGRTQTGFAVLPLYGQTVERNPDDETTFWSRTVLWPFFSAAKGHGTTRLHLPWPFYQFEHIESDGETAYRREFFWPAYGTRERPHESYRFVVWPFYHRWQQHKRADGTRAVHQWLVPFYWDSRTYHADSDTPQTVYRHLWPMARYERKGDQSRFATLSLWPHRNARPIQRNYEPLWTLYTRQKTAEEIRHDALWGAWQFHTTVGAAHAKPGEKPRAEFHLFPFIDATRTGKNYRVRLLKGLLDINNQNDKPNRLLWLIPW